MEIVLLLLAIPLFTSLKNVFTKMGLKEKDSGIDPYFFVALISINGAILIGVFSFLVSAPWAVIVPPDELSTTFLKALSIKAPLQLIAFVTMLYAIRHSLSYSMPLLLLTPILVPFFGIFILDLSEMPSTLGWIGIITIIIGAYLMNGDVMQKGPFEPIKKLFKHKASYLMLITAFIWSITSNYDKIGSSTELSGATPLTWVFYTQIALFALIALVGMALLLFPKLQLGFHPKKSWRNLIQNKLVLLIICKNP